MFDRGQGRVDVPHRGFADRRGLLGHRLINNLAVGIHGFCPVVVHQVQAHLKRRNTLRCGAISYLARFAGRGAFRAASTLALTSAVAHLILP